MIWCNDSFICIVLIIFFCTLLIPGPLNPYSFKWLIIGAQTPLPCFLSFATPVVKVAYLVHWSSRLGLAIFDTIREPDMNTTRENRVWVLYNRVNPITIVSGGSTLNPLDTILTRLLKKKNTNPNWPKVWNKMPICDSLIL
jgi:hypothetical protein